MPALLAPLAVVLLAWAVGRAVGWCTGTPLAPRRLSPFPEVLLGLGLWSWGGFLLAELGAFSPLRVGALLGGAALAAAVVSHRRGTPRERAGWGSAAAGVAIAAVVGVFYLPPYDTMVMASDASLYFSTGVHLARTGALSVADPLVRELGLDVRAALLPVAVTVGWTRLPGGVLVPSGDGEVMWPTYSHLLPVWIATFARVGGLGAVGLVGLTFAALALWAVFLFAREIAGPCAAGVATALAATSVAELFYARFLMPEIVAQLFLWGGLVCFVVWWRDGAPGAAAVAALALGVAGLARVEYLVLVPLALALHRLIAGRGLRGGAAFALVYCALLAHGVAHLLLVPTHYRDVVAAELVALASASGAWRIAGVATAVAMAGGALFLRRPGWRPILRRLGALAIVLAWTAALAARSRPDVRLTLSWLADGTPWPVLAVAAAGLALVLRQLRDDATLGLPLLLFAVGTGTLLYDPHVTPSAIWGLRRFVPVTLPFVCVLAARALPWRRSGALAAGLAAALIVVNARPAATLRRLPLFPDQKLAVAALAERIDPDAAVFFATDLADYAIHLPLWLVHGRETFVLPPWGWQRALRASATTLLPRHRVWYVDAADDPEPSVDGLDLVPRGEIPFRFVLPGPDLTRVPTAAHEWPLVLRLHEVTADGRR